MENLNLASDLRSTEGFIAEDERRIERLQDIDEPTTQDLINLENARQDLAMHEQELNRIRREMGVKPGPAKQFPIRVDLRISQVEQDALGRISRDTGEDRSEIIRRLVREADPR